jgi:predicted RNase H-like nuclease (RuvC/YqgF family)
MALVVTLFHSLPAWAATTSGDTYRNPNGGGRVKCSDPGPMNEYVANIPKREKVLQDKLKELKAKLEEAKKNQADAQKELDFQLRTKGSRGQHEHAQAKLNAAIAERAKLEDEIRAKQSELDRIPKEKAQTLSDITQSCGNLPGDTDDCARPDLPCGR